LGGWDEGWGVRKNGQRGEKMKDEEKGEKDKEREREGQERKQGGEGGVGECGMGAAGRRVERGRDAVREREERRK